MSWESLSGHFGNLEIARIENTPIEDLIRMMLASQPLVALRVFRELYMHGDEVRVLGLLLNASVSEHFAMYLQDDEVTAGDIAYANLFFLLIEGIAGLES